MSFRVRIFVLVAVVALGATAATAAIILRQAERQVREAASTSQQTTTLIHDRLRDKARRDGTWERVHETMLALREQTGQRIRLAQPGGVFVADTDLMEGRASRPPGPITMLVDPLPALVLRAADADSQATTMRAIEAYLTDRLFAVCMFHGRYGTDVVAGPDGLPKHLPPHSLDMSITGCEDELALREQLLDAKGGSPQCGTGEPDCLYVYEKEALGVRSQIRRCGAGNSPTVRTCLQAVFRRVIASAPPEQMVLTIGPSDEPIRVFDTGRLLQITLVVAILVIGSALLISRRVLSPIGTLTVAARRLGSGDRSARVPDNGRDELGELARAFNQMADSVHAAEADQRRLIADVAHELRTPLANLRGYLEAMQDGVLEPTHELFASLHDEVIHNQRIVDDLQELALAEAGALVYHRARTDLAELMETVRTAHRANADIAGVALVVESDGPLVADVDADRIRQAVGNLVANALRATAAGGSVTLRASADDARVVLEVRDTGTGIAAEHLPLLFDRLWRADPARGRESGGSGLGLAIVRQIVGDHDGEVSVRSTPGEGSTFEVRLPLVQPDSTARSRDASGLSTKR